MATMNLITFAIFSTIPPAHMRRKRAHRGHQDIHLDNQGASDMWMSLHILQEIHNINGEIYGTRYDKLFKHVTIQK